MFSFTRATVSVFLSNSARNLTVNLPNAGCRARCYTRLQEFGVSKRIGIDKCIVWPGKFDFQDLKFSSHLLNYTLKLFSRHELSGKFNMREYINEFSFCMYLNCDGVFAKEFLLRFFICKLVVFLNRKKRIITVFIENWK